MKHRLRPCKNDKSSCEPWERDWKSGNIKPGETVIGTDAVASR
jgi:hypothetical protein